MATELVQPKNYDQLYPGRFLKAGTLDGKKVTLTIESVKHEKLEGEKGLELKVVFSFVGKDMQLVCCKTNALCIKAMFGNLVADWIGKKVTLYEGKVETPGPLKGQPCIRVWGSPEIAADLPVPIKLPKRKAFEMVMHRVESRTAPATPAPSNRSAEIPL